MVSCASKASWTLSRTNRLNASRGFISPPIENGFSGFWKEFGRETLHLTASAFIERIDFVFRNGPKTSQTSWWGPAEFIRSRRLDAPNHRMTATDQHLFHPTPHPTHFIGIHHQFLHSIDHNLNLFRISKISPQPSCVIPEAIFILITF